MKIVLLLGCVSSLTFNILAQNLKVNQAEKYFNSYRYAEATPIYKELIQKDNIKILQFETVFRHAVVASNKCRDFNFEYDVLGRISQSDKYTFEDAFSYFQLSIFLGYYDKAKELLTCPIVVNSTDPRKMLLDRYKKGNVWSDIKKDTSIYAIKSVDFNSGTGDFNPIYHPKGIVFTSARNVGFRKSTFDNTPYLNLYLSLNVDGKVQELKFLETLRHDGTAYYDSINQVWFYSKNLPTIKTGNITTTGLFMYDEKTKVETAFPYNDAPYFFAQPFLSEDGLKLWYSSDKPGGFGKADIWYSSKTEQGWSEPVNAGNLVNTSENEMFPFVQKNNLFFSSNGHAGLGGLDIFSVILKDSKVSSLENLGANLNSNGDDFSLVLDKTQKAGYFSSNREEFVDKIYSVVITRLDFVFVGTIIADLSIEKLQSIPVLVKKEGVIISTLYADKEGKFEFKGDKNSAYSFEINEQEYEEIKEDYSTVGRIVSDSTFKQFMLVSNINILITVISGKTKQPLLNSKIEITDKKTGEKVVLITDEKGVIQTKLPRNCEFDMVSSHPEFMDNKSVLSTVTRGLEIKALVELETVEVGSVLAVKDLNYDFEKWNINADSKVELDKVAVFLGAHPKVKIDLSSHTDSRGTDEFNRRLSKKRNQSCINYLVSKGVNKNRINGKWFGESILLNRCVDDIKCTEDEHKINRRTELVVVSID